MNTFLLFLMLIVNLAGVNVGCTVDNTSKGCTKSVTCTTDCVEDAVNISYNLVSKCCLLSILPCITFLNYIHWVIIDDCIGLLRAWLTLFIDIILHAYIINLILVQSWISIAYYAISEHKVKLMSAIIKYGTGLDIAVKFGFDLMSIRMHNFFFSLKFEKALFASLGVYLVIVKSYS